MKNTITTIIGDFTVCMSYQPTADDKILNRFTSVINQNATKALLTVSTANPDLDTTEHADILAKLALLEMTKDDEAKIEKSLYDATRIADGAGQRVEFSLSRREINLARF